MTTVYTTKQILKYINHVITILKKDNECVCKNFYKLWAKSGKSALHSDKKN